MDFTSRNAFSALAITAFASCARALPFSAIRQIANTANAFNIASPVTSPVPNILYLRGLVVRRPAEWLDLSVLQQSAEFRHFAHRLSGRGQQSRGQGFVPLVGESGHVPQNLRDASLIDISRQRHGVHSSR